METKLLSICLCLILSTAMNNKNFECDLDFHEECAYSKCKCPERIDNRCWSRFKLVTLNDDCGKHKGQVHTGCFFLYTNSDGCCESNGKETLLACQNVNHFRKQKCCDKLSVQLHNKKKLSYFLAYIIILGLCAFNMWAHYVVPYLLAFKWLLPAPYKPICHNPSLFCDVSIPNSKYYLQESFLIDAFWVYFWDILSLLFSLFTMIHMGCVRGMVVNFMEIFGYRRAMFHVAAAVLISAQMIGWNILFTYSMDYWINNNHRPGQKYIEIPVYYPALIIAAEAIMFWVSLMLSCCLELSCKKIALQTVYVTLVIGVAFGLLSTIITEFSWKE